MISIIKKLLNPETDNYENIEVTYEFERYSKMPFEPEDPEEREWLQEQKALSKVTSLKERSFF